MSGLLPGIRCSSLGVPSGCDSAAQIRFSACSVLFGNIHRGTPLSRGGPRADELHYRYHGSTGGYSSLVEAQCALVHTGAPRRKNARTQEATAISSAIGVHDPREA